MSEAPNIVVVGLGYVGLPLAVALADHGAVTGFDIDSCASTSWVAGMTGRARSNPSGSTRAA